MLSTAFVSRFSTNLCKIISKYVRTLVIFVTRGHTSFSSQLDGALWEVVSGAEFCQIVDGGRCVTDGEGRYGNWETCKVKALEPLILTTEEYDVETGYDFVSVGNTSFDGESGPQGTKLDAGEELVWQSDGGVSAPYSYYYHSEGFKICASIDAEAIGLFRVCVVFVDVHGALK